MTTIVQKKKAYILKKCTDNCSQEKIFKYQYGGECLEKCPENTSPNNNICIDKVFNSCIKSETEINLYEFLSSV